MHRSAPSKAGSLALSAGLALLSCGELPTQTSHPAREKVPAQSPPPTAAISPGPNAAAAPKPRPSGPEFPLQVLAVYPISQVFSEPTEHAEVIGYLRRGARLRAKPGVVGPGCETRWHALLGGGYVCAGRGFAVSEKPKSLRVMPPPPTLYDALPYDYLKITTRNTPLFTREPTPDEERSVLAALAERHVPEKRRLPEKSRAAKLAQSKPSALPELVRMLLQPGYYVSVAAREPEADGGELIRTVRGGVLEAKGQVDVQPSELHGSALEPGDLGRIAFAYRPGMLTYTRDPATGALTRAEPVHELERFYLSDERVNDARRTLAVASDGRLVPEAALRVVPYTPRPPLVPRGARYIAVQLATQTLVAYEGARPVYATLVSTGKEGHETPTGIFRIEQKHIAATMDAEAVGSDEAYSIEDVPWTMYFSRGLALHAAFWHHSFGRTHSHGCVNLTPSDARWLFQWTAPHLPAGFHGVIATRSDPGTFLVITP